MRRDNHTPFSGIYSPEELALFNDIKDKLAQGEAVSAGTPHSYGERVAGLRAMHAYTIVGVVDKNHPIFVNEKDETIQVKMVRIRNPWGATGRLYLPDQDNPEQIQIVESRDAGTFDLELKDFCRYYESYTSTEQFAKVCTLNEKREALVLKMQALLKNQPQQDVQQGLLTQIDAYFECRANLVTIHMDSVELLGTKIQEQIAAVFNDESKAPEAIKAELSEIISNNKVIMMNIFQTADCDLIAASINYGWKKTNGKLPKEEADYYQNQLIESVVDNDELWKSLHTNYQLNVSIALQPLQDSYILVNTLFNTINLSQLELDKLYANEEGQKQILRALLIQKALLKQHLNYLEKNEQLLQHHGVDIKNLLHRLIELNASIENLEVFKKHPDINENIEGELMSQDLAIDDVTSCAESRLNELVNVGLRFTKLREGEDISQPSDSDPEQPKVPQWVISLRSILERVFEAISSWRKSNTSNTDQQEYNRTSSFEEKYQGSNSKTENISYVDLPTLFNKCKKDYKKAASPQMDLESGSSKTLSP